MKRLIKFEKFESRNSIHFNEILTTVREIAMELDFLDIDASCDSVGIDSNGSIFKNPIRKYGDQSRFIELKLEKPAVFIDDHDDWPTILPSFKYEQIETTVETIIDYLSQFGFKPLPEMGTFLIGERPIVATSGSRKFGTVKSKLHLVFKKDLL